MRRLPCLLLLLALPAATSEHEKWTPELSMEVRTIGEVLPSPDGEWVAYTVTEAVMDEETSDFRTHIHVARADGSRGFQLTRGPQDATNPQFSADGRFLYFKSEREKGPNVWRIALEGGEAERVTEWEGKMQRFAVSPDGSRLAFTGRPKDEEKEKAEKAKLDFRVLSDDEENAALWIAALTDGLARDAGPSRLTSLDEHVGRLDWSPDSSRVAFEVLPSALADDWGVSDLREADAASGSLQELAHAERAEADPRYSPDGRWIAFVAESHPPRWAGDCVFSLIDRQSGDIRDLPLPGPDECGRGTNLVGWSEDSKRLIFTSTEGVENVVLAMSLEGEQSAVFNPDGKVLSSYGGGARLDASGRRLGFALESPTEPPEAYLLQLGQSEPRKLSAVNAELDSPPLGRVEVVRWQSPDGREIEGLLTYPAGYEEGRRYPLVLNIHGGPMGVFQKTFIGRYGLYPIAAFASEGFAVLQPNPRGSSGYGKEFRFANYQDWGGGDYDDIMSGVDHVIEMGVADPDRMVVMGWSYGGFMTSWIIGQTDRFRAAGIGAAVTNLWSFTGTADIPGFLPDYFGGEPWEDFEMYRAHSPMAYVDRIKTPSLILHGEEDKRVPLSQGYELYTALKRRGVEVEMVVYPRTPHGPEEPKFVLDVARRHLALAKEHLADN